MKNNNRKRKTGIFLSALLVLLLAPGSATASPKDIRLSPSSLSIGIFFGGCTMRVEALIPDGCEAVIEVNGKDVQEDLMRKGRRWDLWMNTGEIHVNGVPYLYYVMSTDPRLLLSPAEKQNWGYDALREDISFTGQLKKNEDAKLFNEFINLKEGQQLYRISPGALKTSLSDPVQHVVQADINFPPRISPGTYTVRVFVLKDKNVIERRTTYVDVTMTGIPELVRSLSSTHEYIYAFIAVLLAAAFGLLSGFIFKSKGKGGACH